MKYLILNLYKKLIFLTLLSIAFFSLNVYANPIRIMPLGDSITQGYNISVEEIYQSGYRNYLWHSLNSTNNSVNFVGSQTQGSSLYPYFDYNHEGYAWWLTQDIANEVYGFLASNQPDIILLHIGSNDTSPNQNNSSSVVGINNILNQIDYYEKDYNHSIRVIVATIINRKTYHSTIHTFNTNLKNLVNSRITLGDKITLVDMEYNAGLNSSDYSDEVHPNNNGYEKMSRIWFDTLEDILPTLLPPNPLIKPFVERFYTKILLREGEELGIEYWTEGLATYKLTAADLARGFIFSDEFENQDTDDITFLEILYSAFFDRVSDSDGLSHWEDKLHQGKSRFTVLNGFLYSQEFNSLAQSYNILAVDPSEFFVTRFYTKVLERDPEQDGFTYWVSKLRAQTVTAKDIARAFFFSEEFLNKDVDNINYLTLLYRTLLNREPDRSGLNHWLSRLEEGQSRYKILDSFIYSPEFKNLAETYNVRL